MRTISLMVIWMVVFFITSVGAQNQTPPAETVFTAAVIIEQNVTFAVVLVRPETLNDKNFADRLIDTLEPSFGEIPVVLMVQDAAGTPTYYGRTDIAEFLANVPLESMPWKKYALQTSP